MSITKIALKLLLLTVVSGIIMGCVSKFFLDSLVFVNTFRETYIYFLLLPLVGMLTAFVRCFK